MKKIEGAIEELKKLLEEERLNAEKERDNAEKYKAESESHKERIEQLQQLTVEQEAALTSAQEDTKRALDFRDSNYSDLVKVLFKKPSQIATLISLIIFTLSMTVSIGVATYFDKKAGETLDHRLSVVSSNLFKIDDSLSKTTERLSQLEINLSKKYVHEQEKIEKSLSASVARANADLTSSINIVFADRIGELKSTISTLKSDTVSIKKITTEISQSTSEIIKEKVNNDSIKEKVNELESKLLKSDSEFVTKYVSKYENYKSNYDEFIQVYFLILMLSSDDNDVVLELLKTLGVEKNIRPYKTHELYELDKAALLSLHGGVLHSYLCVNNKTKITNEGRALSSYNNFNYWDTWGYYRRDDKKVHGDYLSEYELVYKKLSNSEYYSRLRFPKYIIYSGDEIESVRKIFKDPGNGDGNKISLEYTELPASMELIKKTQRILAKKNLYSGEIDGILGKKTRDGITKLTNKKYDITTGLTLGILHELDITPVLSKKLGFHDWL